MRDVFRRPQALAAAALILSACRGSVALPPSSLPAPAGADRVAARARYAGSGIQKIDHVVIIVQENRSFNNLFYGFPGAKTVTYGYDYENKKIAIKPIGLATKWDVQHNSQGFILSCNGTGRIPGTDCKMNGFNRESAPCVPQFPGCHVPADPEYTYVPHDQTAPYFSMAKQYVLADQMYASNFDTSSFVSHQYIIAAQANSTTNYPMGAGNWGCPGVDLKKPKENTDWVYTVLRNPPRKTGPEIPVCYDIKTLGDELDAKALSWAFYAPSLGALGPGGKACGSGSGAGKNYVESGIWSTYQVVKHICYGPDWNKDVIPGPNRFLSDVAKGKLRDVTWITPYCKNSDHPGCDSDTGPSWVTSLVNAVGESPFWDSTAIFIFWDDYGGFYDPEPPAYVDYDGLGARIPLLIVSPYARRNFVSHTRYEHGSVLKFIEDRFGLSSLSASDRRAANPYDQKNPDQSCFDFSQSPRKFVPIGSKYDSNYFLHQTPDYRPPDTD